MTALAAARKMQHRGEMTGPYRYDMKASAVVYAGGLVCLLSGYAIAAKTGADSTEAGNMQCVGVAYNDGATGGASDGDTGVDVWAGEFPFKNSASGDLIARTEIGKVCYVVDDQTVAKTSATNTRCIAGRVQTVDSDGTVWVKVGPGLAA